MEHSARDARERGWIWLLRAVGGLLAVVVVVNLVHVGRTLLAAAVASPVHAASAQHARADTVELPGAYHLECAEFRPTMAARVSNAVQQMLPARLIAAEGELPHCRRCGERIEPGSQIWITGG